MAIEQSIVHIDSLLRGHVAASVYATTDQAGEASMIFNVQEDTFVLETIACVAEEGMPIFQAGACLGSVVTCAIERASCSSIK